MYLYKADLNKSHKVSKRRRASDVFNILKLLNYDHIQLLQNV